MQPYPHHYSVEASAAASGSIELRADRLPPLTSAAPIEFDGPGDQWSPETLLVAAVADCFALTFRAIARASKLEWSSLRSRATGTLDRDDRITRFVGMQIEAELTLPAGGDVDAARRLLEKAEKNCLVSNSLDLAVELKAKVAVGE
jgi:organic hydroperoxide reductase OsmC/OhrA